MKYSLLFAASLIVLAAPLSVRAQEPHDSNTLHKIGKAIQYPVNKAGQNTSKTTHKATQATQYPVNKAGQNTSITTHKVANKNSVTTVKPSDTTAVVTPSGDKVPAGTNP